MSGEGSRGSPREPRSCWLLVSLSSVGAVSMFQGRRFERGGALACLLPALLPSYFLPLSCVSLFVASLFLSSLLRFFFLSLSFSLSSSFFSLSLLLSLSISLCLHLFFRSLSLSLTLSLRSLLST